MIILETVDRTPLLIQGIPLGIYHLIAAYHAALMAQARRVTLYWEPECDRYLYTSFSNYYHAIAQRLSDSFDPAILTPASRHRFFIASEPVPHPADSTQTLPGLSQIEQLLGMSYSKPSPPTTGIPAPAIAEITTGDRVLDLITDTYLIFEGAATAIIDRFDAETVGKMIRHKCDRQRGEEALKERQGAIDKEWMVKYEQQIMSQNGRREQC